MRVFNLTDQTVDYRGRHIQAYGSVEITDISFIPNRDRFLADRGMLAFGNLPVGWKKPEPKMVVPPPAPVETVKVKLSETVKVEASPMRVIELPAMEAPKEENRDFKKKK